MNTAWGAYMHVPFCVSRCNYCDFNTYAGMERYADAYFQALNAEIGSFWDGGAAGGAGAGAYADTVFIGGGTPSSVDPAYITGALRRIPGAAGGDSPEARRFSFYDPSWECTIEANPGSLDSVKLKTYADAGVNRLSVGLQSSHENHLKTLGRVHSFEDFRRNIREAKDAGFENISADLIFGLPGQTSREWEQTLEAAVLLGLCHLSCYSLSLGEGTPLHNAVSRGDLPYPDEDLDRDMYGFAISYLRSAGLYQYEMSNFAMPDRECRHNLKYWTGGRYIGFGAGAHSYDGRFRFSNAVRIPEYIELVNAARAPDSRGSAGGLASGAAPRAAVVESAEIDAAEREKEFIILRLRLTEGFCESDFRAEFGCGFFDKYYDEVNELTGRGLVEAIGGAGKSDGAAQIRRPGVSAAVPAPKQSAAAPESEKYAVSHVRADTAPDPDPRLRLTRKGMDLANQVFLKFI